MTVSLRAAGIDDLQAVHAFYRQLYDDLDLALDERARRPGSTPSRHPGGPCSWP